VCRSSSDLGSLDSPRVHRAPELARPVGRLLGENAKPLRLLPSLSRELHRSDARGDESACPVRFRRGDHVAAPTHVEDHVAVAGNPILVPDEGVARKAKRHTCRHGPFEPSRFSVAITSSRTCCARSSRLDLLDRERGVHGLAGAEAEPLRRALQHDSSCRRPASRRLGVTPRPPVGRACARGRRARRARLQRPRRARPAAAPVRS
jgi:hypothetical protein